MDHEQRRGQIADALLSLAADQGLEAVSLRTVAARAGVTAGMVQHYFPSKDAMVEHAMGAAVARYEVRVRRATASGDADADPRAVLRAVLATFVPRTPEERADARVVLAFQSYAGTRPAAAASLAEGNAGMAELLAGLARAAAPGLADAEARAVGTGLLALAEGLGVQVTGSALDPDTALDALDVHLDRVLGVPPG